MKDYRITDLAVVVSLVFHELVELIRASFCLCGVENHGFFAYPSKPVMKPVIFLDIGQVIKKQVKSDPQYFLVGLLKQIAFKLILGNGFFLRNFNLIFTEQVAACGDIFGRGAGCQDQYRYQRSILHIS